MSEIGTYCVNGALFLLVSRSLSSFLLATQMSLMLINMSLHSSCVRIDCSNIGYKYFCRLLTLGQPLEGTTKVNDVNYFDKEFQIAHERLFGFEKLCENHRLLPFLLFSLFFWTFLLFVVVVDNNNYQILDTKTKKPTMKVVVLPVGVLLVRVRKQHCRRPIASSPSCSSNRLVS